MDKASGGADALQEIRDEVPVWQQVCVPDLCVFVRLLHVTTDCCAECWFCMAPRKQWMLEAEWRLLVILQHHSVSLLDHIGPILRWSAPLLWIRERPNFVDALALHCL